MMTHKFDPLPPRKGDKDFYKVDKIGGRWNSFK